MYNFWAKPLVIVIPGKATIIFTRSDFTAIKE